MYRPLERFLMCCLIARGFVVLVSQPLLAQTSYPMLMSLSPVAAAAGTTSEHDLESRYSMFGARQVFVTGKGVTAEVVTPMERDKDGKEPSLTKVTLRVTVDPTALPGVRDVRITGPWGASTIAQLVISRDAVVAEADDNNTADKSQPVTLPATLCGTLEKAEDIDYFRFTLSEPTSLCFHCRAMRLEDKIHDLQQHVDPIITVKTAAGATVAAADNTYAADPLLVHHFAEPGDYLLEVRDVRYQGNKYWNYSIEVSARPYVSNVHPVAIHFPAEQTAVPIQLVGFQLPEQAIAELTLPPQAGTGVHDLQLPLADSRSNAVSMLFADIPVAVEGIEINDTPEQAQTLEIASGVSGRIEAESDIDLYKFEAEQGDKLDVEVYARRLGSELDSIVAILDSTGKRLTENDDLRLWSKISSQDALIEGWTAPAAGTYFIEIRDVHLRGGEAAVYFLKLTRSEPNFVLYLDTDKTPIFPGSCGALFVRADRRHGFAGEIDLQVEGLPPGVKATCGKIRADAKDGCIIFESTATEPVAANITVRGTAALPESPEGAAPLTAIAQPMQEIYMPGGGRSHWPVEMHTLAVGSPTDLRGVKLSNYDVQLKPGESVTIDVDITRAEGFDKNVTLDLQFQHLSSVFADTLPKGVTIDSKTSKTLLTGQESQGKIVLTASAEAPPIDKQLCSLMANVSINFVMKATYSSQPLRITVLPK